MADTYAARIKKLMDIADAITNEIQEDLTQAWGERMGAISWSDFYKIVMRYTTHNVGIIDTVLIVSKVSTDLMKNGYSISYEL